MWDSIPSAYVVMYRVTKELDYERQLPIQPATVQQVLELCGSVSSSSFVWIVTSCLLASVSRVSTIDMCGTNP
jgi:hypothetical protein